MKQLQKAGMSLAQIFRAATISNAREFKMESQVGSIEPGKAANLVLMRNNPLEAIDAYDSITTVGFTGNRFFVRVWRPIRINRVGWPRVGFENA
jgi:imidazolonepropionase-like amidohydrolase